MNRFLTIIGLIVLTAAASAMPQTVPLKETPTAEFRKVKNQSFTYGEKLKYRLHYGLIDAGEAVIEVRETDRKVKGRELYHIYATGTTLPAFDLFYKVRDRYESYIDKDGLFPWVFVRRVNEGGFKFNQDYTFYQHKNFVKYDEDKKYEVPNFCQDMISAFFYARNMDFSDMEEGDRFTIKTFLDDSLYDLTVEYAGTDNIKLRKGKYRCMKFNPVVVEGRIFKSKDDLEVWVTADKNHIPILVKANIFVGSIKMEVIEYEGVLNPVAEVD